MATRSNPGELEFIGHVLNDKLPKEGPVRKIANTVTAVVGSLISIAAVALSLPIDIPDWGYLIIVAVTTLGTALGVRSTKNGFSESQRRKLRDWMAQYIDDNHDIPDYDGPARPTAEGSSPASAHSSGGSERVTVQDLIGRVRSHHEEASGDLSTMVEQARSRWYGNR